MTTQAEVAECFEYRDGTLYWRKVAHPNKQYLLGQEVGSLHKTGYRHVTWRGRIWKVHRLVYLLHHGVLPKEIDHINGCRADNRLENLRAVTRSQNQFNKAAQRNASGCRGVTWHAKTKKWCVRVMMHAKTYCFGYYDNLELADLVAQEARAKLYGQYAFDCRAA